MTLRFLRAAHFALCELWFTIFFICSWIIAKVVWRWTTSFFPGIYPLPYVRRSDQGRRYDIRNSVLSVPNNGHARLIHHLHWHFLSFRIFICKRLVSSLKKSISFFRYDLVGSSKPFAKSHFKIRSPYLTDF